VVKIRHATGDRNTPNIKPFLHVEAAGAQRAVDEDQGERIMLAGDAASSRRSA